MLKITPQSRLDFRLAVWMQFGAISTEHLDAVVLRRIVAGRHHQAPCCTNLPDQKGHCRRGAQAKGPDIATARRQTSGQSSDKHAAAAAGIHTNQDRPFLLQHLTHPVTHLQAERWREHGSCMAANAIGAETGNSGAKAGANRWHGALNHRSESWPEDYGQSFRMQRVLSIV